jgi:ProP effector
MTNSHSQKKYIDALATIALLEERWPKAFVLDQTKRRPLKVGIRDDILAAGVEITPSALSNALRTYTVNRFYQQSLRAGASRIDLDGEPAGSVSVEDAKRASDELRRRRFLKATVGQDAAASTGPVHGSPAPMSEHPRRLSLSDLRAAAMARKLATA